MSDLVPIVAGAMVGFGLAGPPGALVGALFGGMLAAGSGGSSDKSERTDSNESAYDVHAWPSSDLAQRWLDIEVKRDLDLTDVLQNMQKPMRSTSSTRPTLTALAASEDSLKHRLAALSEPERHPVPDLRLDPPSMVPPMDLLRSVCRPNLEPPVMSHLFGERAVIDLCGDIHRRAGSSPLSPPIYGGQEVFLSEHNAYLGGRDARLADGTSIGLARDVGGTLRLEKPPSW